MLLPHISVLNLVLFPVICSFMEVAQEFGSSGPGPRVVADSQRSGTPHVLLTQLLRLRQCCCHLSLLKSVRRALRVLPHSGCGSRGMAFGGVSVFWWGREEEAAVFYFILVFIDLEIIPIVLEQLLLFCFCK